MQFARVGCAHVLQRLRSLCRCCPGRPRPGPPSSLHGRHPCTLLRPPGPRIMAVQHAASLPDNLGQGVAELAGASTRFALVQVQSKQSQSRMSGGTWQEQAAGKLLDHRHPGHTA